MTDEKRSRLRGKVLQEARNKAILENKPFSEGDLWFRLIFMSDSALAKVAKVLGVN